jgi:hypothetical protein
MTNPDMGTAIDLNGTGISMYPTPAWKMMTDIAKILTDAQDVWTRASGQIHALEGKLGDGPMGKPFRKQYNPAAKQLDKVVNGMVENLGQVSQTGKDAVPMYINADLQAGYHFTF